MKLHEIIKEMNAALHSFNEIGFLVLIPKLTEILNDIHMNYAVQCIKGEYQVVLMGIKEGC